MSSCETCPVEAMIGISDTESVKSIAELTTSNTISGAELQTGLEVLDWHKECKRSFFFEEEAAPQEKRLFLGKGKSHG